MVFASDRFTIHHWIGALHKPDFSISDQPKPKEWATIPKKRVN
jgi:hypothetical protein